jgi:Glycosyl transferases group 1
MRQIFVHFGGSEDRTTGVHYGRAVERLGTGRSYPAPRNTHPEICRLVEGSDAYLWVEAGNSSYPIDIERCPVPTVGILIDVHLHTEFSMLQAQLFDLVLVAQKDYVDRIREVNQNCHWLPLAAPAAFLELPRDPVYEVGFVGQAHHDTRREQILSELNRHFGMNDWRRPHSVPEMGEAFSKSAVVVNPPVNGDLNMRFFEAMACGAAVLVPTDLSNGLDEIGAAQEHYARADFQDEADVVGAVRGLLASGRAASIGRAARELVASGHTYEARVARIRELADGLELCAPIRNLPARERARILFQIASRSGYPYLAIQVAQRYRTLHPSDLGHVGWAIAHRVRHLMATL